MMKDITKTFPGVTANDHVELWADRGEILAIVGENGAGKSTLMSILYGHYKPDEGEIYINGRKEKIDSPKKAIELGIGMVFQHFMLVPTLTVYENIILGMEPIKGAGIDKGTAVKSCEAVIKKYGFDIDVLKKAGELSLGEQHKVEIIKALYRNAEILILDEPTAVLTPKEAEELFHSLREFANQGKTIIFITHKLAEVMALADRITVLRKGRTVGTVMKSETSQEQLAEMMVGRKVILRTEKKETQAGETALIADNLCAGGNSRSGELKDLSFEIRKGEILGIAGVEGNGQTELLEVLTGLRKPTKGNILLNGTKLTGLRPRAIRENRVVHIPEDRHKRGLVLSFSLEENLIAGIHYRKKFRSRFGFLKREVIAQHAECLIEKYDIRGGDRLTAARSLSGGNQQKVIIARELEQDYDFLLASQPTRGVDVGAIEFIHKKILEARDDGKAVMVISADLQEILTLSDRIAVLFEGRIAGVTDAKNATQRSLGLMMSGAEVNERKEDERNETE